MSKKYRDVTTEELFGLCANAGKWQAWDELIRRLHPVIVATVLRVGQRYAKFQPDLREDLVQEVYAHLVDKGGRALRSFVPRHPNSAFGYIVVIAARVTHDCMKSKGFARISEVVADLPEIVAADQTEWRILARKLDDIFLRNNVAARDRSIFWLYYRQGFTAKEIAALPAIGLTVKGVESVLVRLQRLARDKFS